MSRKKRKNQAQGAIAVPQTETAAPAPESRTDRKRRIREQVATGPTADPMRVPRVLLVVLVAAGLILTGYLTGSTWAESNLAYCGADSGCGVVQGSRWSVLFGLPLAAWGFAVYALLGALLWRTRRHASAWGKIWLLACLGLGVSLYLTGVSVVSIKATCAYCLTSLGLLAAIVAVTAFALPKEARQHVWRDRALTGALSAAALVGALHMHYSGVFDASVGPEKPYLRALALHLEKTGAKFYGAYWCRHCEDQKALFEASAKRLPYVECKPNGPNGQTTAACAVKDIASFPTWIIGDERYEGISTPRALASYSDFDGAGLAR